MFDASIHFLSVPYVSNQTPQNIQMFYSMSHHVLYDHIVKYL